MSRHLHLDLVGGIAGDMTVAALVDAGAGFEELRRGLLASGLPVTHIELVRDACGGLAGARFVVQPEASPLTRRWRDIRELLHEAQLPDRARQTALAAFAALAEAEGAVHGCEPEQAHFHEVGAMDSIVDIVTASLALDLLDVTSCSCGAVPVCEGHVATSHGRLPLPAPATAHLLEGFTLLPIDGDVETITPTGAALLATLCPGGGWRPPGRLLSSGVGLGTASLPDRPNVLRVLLSEPAPTARDAPRGDAVLLQADIDDMDPRLFGAVSASLFGAGALDVTLSGVQMKKGRPGTRLSVLCRPELEGVLTGVVLRETTTLGVRSHDVRRTELERRLEPLDTPFGPVRVKLGLLGGECLNATPEYDDCERLAREHDVPVKDVLDAATAAAASMRRTAPC